MGLTIIFSVIYTLQDGPIAAQIVTGVTEAAIAVVGIIYFARGAGKSESKFYKTYFLIISASYVIEWGLYLLLESGEPVSNTDMLELFIEMICFGNYLVLALGNDLGKKKSFGLVGCNVVLYLIFIVPAVIEIATEGYSIYLWETLAYIVSCAFDIVIVYSKYRDKEARGTK